MGKWTVLNLYLFQNLVFLNFTGGGPREGGGGVSMIDIEKQTMTPQNKASSFSRFNWDFQLVLECLILKIMFQSIILKAQSMYFCMERSSG